MSTAENDRLVWIDCEMTGLDPQTDQLVEIAIIVTDFTLNPLDNTGFQQVIIADGDALASMNETVTEMHRRSGLLDEIPQGMPLAEAEKHSLEYIKQFVPVAGKAPLAGNTIGTDRMFLNRYMPELDQWLHYRNVDVSAIKELARRWYPSAYFQTPAKAGNHRALDDIRESVRELEYYRRIVFVPEPGPKSDAARTVASEVVTSWKDRM